MADSDQKILAQAASCLLRQSFSQPAEVCVNITEQCSLGTHLRTRQRSAGWDLSVCGGAQGAGGLSVTAANTGSKRFHNKRVSHTTTTTDTRTLLSESSP